MPQRPHPRLLITAGPTREPLDEVRYISNRSSGRMGLAIAEAARSLGWPTTLLLGPVTRPVPRELEPLRFETTTELAALLRDQWPSHDLLIMAAAVSDHRPVRIESGKTGRTGDRTLDLEPTEDLVAALAEGSRPDQIRIGFALEEPDSLEERAREKLASKQLHAIVANPLATMDSETITAQLIDDNTSTSPPPNSTKEAFAVWLLDEIAARYSPGIVDTSPVHGLDADA
ncbi:MAG: phosphopantothenoylcysteine decarboxylase [Phycisphaerales bacterium]|nr:phosphopantothenoylcysteine decarboxylase [Phycisphaerales bacterium]